MVSSTKPPSTWPLSRPTPVHTWYVPTSINPSTHPADCGLQNEGDVYQSEHEKNFWGTENYAKLLTIKNKYDPLHILDCWQCGMSSPRI